MAVTRKEQIASGKKVTPLTREEARLAGKEFAPLTEEERFQKVAYSGEGGGGGGGLSIANVTISFEGLTDGQVALPLAIWNDGSFQLLPIDGTIVLPAIPATEEITIKVPLCEGNYVIFNPDIEALYDVTLTGAIQIDAQKGLVIKGDGTINFADA